MTSSFNAIQLFQQFVGISINAQQLRYIAAVAQMSYDEFIVELITNQHELLKGNLVDNENFIIKRQIQQQHVNSFALALESAVCKQVISELSPLLNKRLTNQLLSAASFASISKIALLLWLYSLQCCQFTQFQQRLLLKAVEPQNYKSVVQYFSKQNVSEIDVKYEIGTLYNRNLFLRADVEYLIETFDEVILTSGVIQFLRQKSAALRFCSQLENWYCGRNEQFWGFRDV